MLAAGAGCFVLSFTLLLEPRKANAGTVLGPPLPLKIVSFDLAAAAGLATVTDSAAKRPSWRTSFGSEIRSETRRARPALAIDADVVLLQGLASIREARRLFPAREWKLVVSRQILSMDEVPDEARKFAATAVAVRYQTDVRVTGQDHLMDLGGAGDLAPAATAVRLTFDGRTMWILSAALPEGCAGEASCAAAAAIERWRRARRDAGDMTVAGGPRLASAARDVARPCSQSIGVDEGWFGAVTPRSTTELHPVAGCLATLDLHR
jgi:hypothetical protein